MGTRGVQDVWDVEQAAALIRQFSAHCGRMMLFMESLRCIRTQHTLQDSAAVPLSQVSKIAFCRGCWHPFGGICFPINISRFVCTINANG